MNSGLPYADKVHIDESKVTDYLLNPAKSRGKAGFFLRFSFTPESWQEMARALALLRAIFCVFPLSFPRNYGWCKPLGLVTLVP